jgi:integrase
VKAKARRPPHAAAAADIEGRRLMGTIYRRKVRFCTTCDQRLDTTAAWRACEAAGHAIEIREQAIWWVKYQLAGRPVCVSSGSERKEEAKQLLREREHLVDTGAGITSQANRITFDEAAADLLTDYTTNKRRSLRVLTLRLEKHLTPFFARRRLLSITTTDVRAYTATRHAEGASNASINRDLIVVKRMCMLAMQAGKLMVRPYIPLLQEANVRKGFFEREQCERVKTHLPRYMRGIAAFAFITGWRTPSEILPLEWRHVDMKAGEVRLDAGTTKNGEARTFPLTRDLRRVLDDQLNIAQHLTRERGIPTRFVFCYTVGEKAGQRITESGYNKQWRKARVAAGCPGRIPHDFRRTAVRNLVRAGVPERVAMALTGHKTRAIFERYNITSPHDLRDAARRLDAYAAAAR